MATASAQPVRIANCNNNILSHTADSLKTLFSENGFTLLRENRVTMASGYELPIILQMAGNGWYHFVFLAEPTSRLNEVRLYDHEEHRLEYQKQLSRDHLGYINQFAFIAPNTGTYMFKPVQVNKKQKEGLCGYVLLFKRTSTN